MEKLYEDAVQRGADVARKVNDADGPLHLDADEAATLKVLLLGFQKEAQIAQEATAASQKQLYRNQLQVVLGSDGFDLAPMPDQPATVN